MAKSSELAVAQRTEGTVSGKSGANQSDLVRQAAWLIGQEAL